MEEKQPFNRNKYSEAFAKVKGLGSTRSEYFSVKEGGARSPADLTLGSKSNAELPLLKEDGEGKMLIRGISDGIFGTGPGSQTSRMPQVKPTLLSIGGDKSGGEYYGMYKKKLDVNLRKTISNFKEISKHFEDRRSFS